MWYIIPMLILQMSSAKTVQGLKKKTPKKQKRWNSLNQLFFEFQQNNVYGVAFIQQQLQCECIWFEFKTGTHS